MKKPLRIALFFSHKFQALEEQVTKGESPRERLYGIDELRARGAEIDVRDGRFAGLSGKILSRLKQRGLNSISFGDIFAILRADVVYVKDNFSTLISLLCFLFGKRLVYCDAAFYIPKGTIKNILTKINLYLADVIISYSSSQREAWINHFGKVAGKIEVHDFSIDSDFYKKFRKEHISGQTLRLISVGRDPGREYKTLFSVIGSLADFTQLSVVAPTYLMPNMTFKNISTKDNISYEELFNIYGNADASIVPIKQNTIYPSGIRAILESIVLGKPVIAARTDFLMEIFIDRENIIFFDPENENSLREQIYWVKDNVDSLEKISRNADRLIENRFSFTKTTQHLVDRIIGED